MSFIGTWTRSLPRKEIRPSWIRAVSGGRSFMIESEVTDLPEPDSPTTTEGLTLPPARG